MIPSRESLFETLDPDALRRALEDFYDQVFVDPMIGFLFHGKDKARLVELEFQLTAKVLGGAVAYTGRGMRAAHAALGILGGQFRRRNRIMRAALEAHGMPGPVVEAVMAHARALERAIVARPGDCVSEPAEGGGGVVVHARS